MQPTLPLSRASRRALLLEVRSVYRKADAAWSAHGCPASGECCQLTRTGRQPWLYAGEWELLVESLQGRPLPPARADGACPFLDSSGLRCSAYADRPFGCRTFFCSRMTGPAREPATAADALLRRLDAVHQDALESSAPRPLLDWHRAAAGG